MLIAENKPPFDSPDYIYELKFDGIRCLAYLDMNGTELRNKRNKSLNFIYPELCEIHKNISRRCILDGELIVINNGRPDFQEVQRRSLMTNPFKIKLAADKLPVCFTAYDVLYIGDEPVTARPLMWRLGALNELVKETPTLAISRIIEREGVAFFNVTKDQGLEGIVAKRKDSLYFSGKRTKNWVKIKNLLDEDFIICGYYRNDESNGAVASVIIGGYKNGQLVYQGHVALGVSRHDFKLLEQSDRADASMYHSAGFLHFNNAIWLTPKLVCTIQYMERTKTGGLRQPVFKGIRLDKLPDECVLPELK